VCPFCHQDAPKVLQAKDTNRVGVGRPGERFDYYRCSSCQLWFLHPVPDDLVDRYPSEYYSLPGPEQFAEGMRAEAYKVDLLRPHRDRGSLLEIGPACGYFAGAAAAAGYDVSVIEMNPACCAYMRDRLGIRVHQSDDIVGVLRTLPRFDVIALWHVIEHLPDPWSVLRAAAERLSDGGVLAFATPNPDALQFRILRSAWTHLDAPRHVYLLPSRHMVSFVSGLGLTVQDVTSLDAGSIHWNLFGWEESFAHFAPRGRRYLRRIARGVARIAAPLETKQLAGSAYTLIARSG
jgi:protein-L-isoaspartate O-methyltransferase